MQRMVAFSLNVTHKSGLQPPNSALMDTSERTLITSYKVKCLSFDETLSYLPACTSGRLVKHSVFRDSKADGQEPEITTVLFSSFFVQYQIRCKLSGAFGKENVSKWVSNNYSKDCKENV